MVPLPAAAAEPAALATEDAAVEDAEPPQAARPEATIAAADAFRKLRRVIFFITKSPSFLFGYVSVFCCDTELLTFRFC